MQQLNERIQNEGLNLGRGILKVDSFLNHQVDPALMLAVGQTLARQFDDLPITKVLTAEISGITPAVMTALELGVPVVYARKQKPITMPKQVYRQMAPSHTKGHNVELLVSPEFLGADDTVLIIDDFLATGNTISALIQICQQAQATVLGVGTVIEKRFEGGRERLESIGLRVRSAAIIEKMTASEIILAKDSSS
ncbi:xanthine phosphoribosyltransferase [Anaerolineales bacterium HSG6]|nr:xanthine phosphoribosyltransferase [Anaerolineales bacterium HSG6]MDM8531979.1 xanthine phosphoribosyltransferase [Anaerolineales bacterium HSG25]